MAGQRLMSKMANSMTYKSLSVNSCLSFTLNFMFCGDRMLMSSCKEMFFVVSLLIYWFKTDYFKKT